MTRRALSVRPYVEEVHQEISARNEKAKEKGIKVSGDVYHYLDPVRVPNSVAI